MKLVGYTIRYSCTKTDAFYLFAYWFTYLKHHEFFKYFVKYSGETFSGKKNHEIEQRQLPPTPRGNVRPD